MNTENRNSDYEELMQYLEETQAYETALILFEWDEETLAPEEAIETALATPLADS